RALDGSDPVCVEALDAFCAMLGTAAADLAVTLGARGGIYIGGGIVPRLGTWFDRSPFRARFEDKGRLGEYVAGIPTYVITAENATFLGASAILDAQLRARGAADKEVALLEQIRRVRASLSPAERRVADRVIAQPRAVLSDPVAEIARAADVSQPTVIRFCRSLGCEGLSDFKRRLAGGLTGTVPLAHTQVTYEDTTLELGAKVLGNTASAILQARDELNRDMIDRAIELLSSATRVDLHAAGHYSAVAQDAQFKFLRFGLPSAASVEPRLQLLAADVTGPGDVAIVISGNGRAPDLVEVVEKVRARGGAVIAITASQSPLARKADVTLIVDHVEDVSTHVPMVSRILHLLYIDILAVGLAMQRKEAPPDEAATHADAAAIAADAADAVQPPAHVRRRRGRSTSTSAGVAPLSRLTSHSR
ncbi:MAG TPA: glucokinase, partial [Burkholderiaceae bacterium]|nr:glucokinase [Burkholderiaceae bacterium]